MAMDGGSNRPIVSEQDNFVFETVMRVRNTEIGFGQHLTIEALVALLTETRLRFLYSRGVKEMNAEYQGILIKDLNTQVLSRARAREELFFEVGVKDLSEMGGSFIFKVSRMFDGSLVAYATIGFIVYDYRQGKPIAMTQELREAFAESQPFDL